MKVVSKTTTTSGVMVLGVLVGHVTVITQQQFVEFLCLQFSSSTEWWTFQSHADLGTHSAHCTADSSWDGCQRACSCAAAGALVGSCRKLWSFRSCSFGCRPVPGQGCCARRCNDCGSRNAWFDFGYMFFLGRLLEVCVRFSLREGVDSAPELDSRLAFLASTSSTTAVACTFLVLLVSCTSRYVPTIAGGLQRSVQSMLRLLPPVALGNLYIIFSELPGSFSMFSVRIFARVDFLEPSSTHTCEEG